jgi:hypothetical protein
MNASDIKAFDSELRPHIEALLDSAEVLKGLASAAREKGIDWGELKKLVKAQALDARDGTDKRVAAIIERADFAASYADMLGFGTKMNDFSESRSCSPEPYPQSVANPYSQVPSPLPDAGDIPKILRRRA